MMIASHEGIKVNFLYVRGCARPFTLSGAMEGHPPRLRFFFPRTKVDHDSQTDVVFSPEPPRESTVARMRSSALRAIVTQEPRPVTQIELSYLLDFSARVGFFASDRADDRFDVLTAPPNLFEEIPIGFCATFYDGGFQFALPDGAKPISFDCDPTLYPLVESFETGLVSRELLIVLRKKLQIDPSAWEEGRIICQITDFRSTPPTEYRRLLLVADDVVAYCTGQKLAQPQLLEGERQVLVLVHPTICIDPSPDVARVQSVIDWRNKMWKNRKQPEKANTTFQEPEIPVISPIGKATLSGLSTRIDLPESIMRFLGGAAGGGKSSEPQTRYVCR
jgi:hypothetical protein